MDAISIHVHPLDAVPAPDKRAMVGLALEVTPGLGAPYVSRTLETYGFVASAWRGERLLAFLLFDQRSALFGGGAPENRTTPQLALTYLGPVFSKGGLCAFVFASLLRAHMGSSVPFCIGMEIECEKAERTLRRLLPRSAFPVEGSGEVPPVVRALARTFAKSFDRSVVLDEERLWTQVKEPMASSSARRGYCQMMLVPCLATEARQRVLADLAGGLESLRRHRAYGVAPELHGTIG